MEPNTADKLNGDETVRGGAKMNETFEPLNATPKKKGGFFNLQEYSHTFFNRDFSDSNFFSRWTY